MGKNKLEALPWGVWEPQERTCIVTGVAPSVEGTGSGRGCLGAAWSLPREGSISLSQPPAGTEEETGPGLGPGAKGATTTRDHWLSLFMTESATG